jgi:hypothetical protein
LGIIINNSPFCPLFLFISVFKGAFFTSYWEKKKAWLVDDFFECAEGLTATLSEWEGMRGEGEWIVKRKFCCCSKI